MMKLGLLLLCCLLGALALDDYSQRGPHSFRTSSKINYNAPTSTECAKYSNQCKCVIEVTYPTSSGTFPVLVYTNGFSMNMRGYVSFAEHAASWGYVVVRWNPDEGFFGGITQNARGKVAGHLANWAVEESQKNPSSPFYGKVSPTAGSVQAGHSLGGKNAALAAIYEPFTKGFIGMDPVDCPPPMPPGIPYDDDNPQAIAMLGQTKAPGLFIGAELGDIGELVPCAPKRCNYEQYFANATAPSMEVTVIGAGHAQWIDNTSSGGRGGCNSGPQQTSVVQMVSRTLMVAWAQKTVYGEDISYWTGEWIEEMKRLKYVDYRLK